MRCGSSRPTARPSQRAVRERSPALLSADRPGVRRRRRQHRARRRAAGPHFAGRPASSRSAATRSGRSAATAGCSGSTATPAGCRPSRGFKAMSVAAGDGQVWAVARDRRPSQPNLVRLDPASDGRVGRSPPRAVGSVAEPRRRRRSGLGDRPVHGRRVADRPRAGAGRSRTINVDFGVDSVAAAGKLGLGGRQRDRHRQPHRSGRPTASRRASRSVARRARWRSAPGGVWVAVAGGDRAAAGPLPRRAKVRPLEEPGCGPSLTAPGAAAGPADRRRPAAAGAVHDHDPADGGGDRLGAARARLPRRAASGVALQTCDDSSRADRRSRRAQVHGQRQGVRGQPGRDRRRRADPLVLRRGDAAGPQSRLRRARLARLADEFARVARRAAPEAPAGHRARSIRPASAATRASTRPTTRCRPRPWSPPGNGCDERVLSLRRAGAGRGGCTSAPPRAATGLRIAGEAALGPGRRELPRARAACARRRARRPSSSTAACTSTSGTSCATFVACSEPDFPILATEAALPITQLFDEAGPAARGVRIVLGGQQPEPAGRHRPPLRAHVRRDPARRPRVAVRRLRRRGHRGPARRDRPLRRHARVRRERAGHDPARRQPDRAARRSTAAASRPSRTSP